MKPGVLAAAPIPSSPPAAEVIGLDGSVSAVPGDKPLPSPSSVRATWIPGVRPAPAPAGSVLALADGQRIVGVPALAGGEASWVSQWLAPRALDLDEIRAIVFEGGAEPSPADEDVVDLRNGDRASGIVTALTATAVTVERGVPPEATSIEIPLEQVLSIRLVSAPRQPSGARAWLSDGSVIDAPGLEWTGTGHLVGVDVPGARAKALTIPRSRVLGVRASPGAVRALASMLPEPAPPDSQPSSRAWLPAPTVARGTWPLDAPPIDIEGPVTLRFGDTGAPATLRMSVRRTVVARSAGTPELVVRSGGSELLRRRLGANEEAIDVEVRLPAGEFELELSREDGGLAGNHAVLERAILLPDHGSTGTHEPPSQR